jgi:transcription antitermination factor NusG
MLTLHHQENCEEGLEATRVDTFEQLVNWFAIYTRSRHEKHVYLQCQQQEIESFLPLYNALHRWKDRRVSVQLPLFPGYVFIKIRLRERLRVLRIPGAIRMVGFDGHPAALDETEIEALRRGISSGMPAKPHARLAAGRRVRVTRGPMEGLQGIIIRNKKQLRLVVSLDLIHCAASIEVDAADLEQM